MICMLWYSLYTQKYCKNIRSIYIKLKSSKFKIYSLYKYVTYIIITMLYKNMTIWGGTETF